MEELIEKAKKGNKDAFTELIISMQDELYKIARMRLSNEEDIDDVIQETMLSTLYGIKHLNYPQYFKTWIIKILINKIMLHTKITNNNIIINFFTPFCFSLCFDIFIFLLI